MIANGQFEQELRTELDDFRLRFPRLADDQLFVLWFLVAYVTDDEIEASEALTGGSRDKGVDAVHVDDKMKCITIIQGKYRESLGKKAESRPHVISFAQLARELTGESSEYEILCDGLAPAVERLLSLARRRLIKDGYRLQLYYVTVGRCSESLLREARSTVRTSFGEAYFNLIQGRQLVTVLKDYLDGVAPPVPEIFLEMESSNAIGIDSIFRRVDRNTGIRSWIFSMNANAIASVYRRGQNRLFARNVRAFLGSTEINRGMESTLRKEPQNFWYFNNGITVICDGASESTKNGVKMLKVSNPQIINGQQTTRMIAKLAETAPFASVTVRVISALREDGERQFEELLSQIVMSSNWQNSIKPSDLVSNDRKQIYLEREFRKLRYLYIRKRQTKSEVKSISGGGYFATISKDELAKAVAACEFDPAIVRGGKENLFEEDMYKLIFSSAEPYYYLVRYWLMKSVGSAAKGFPERAYAKWLVINFLGPYIFPLVRAKSGAIRFCRKCEIGDGFPLNKVTDIVFREALRFFRASRGTGSTAIDVSSFFRKQHLDTEFAKYWRGTRNKSRKAFKDAWRNFEMELEGVEN